MNINIPLKEFYIQKNQSFRDIKPQPWPGEHSLLHAYFPDHLWWPYSPFQQQGWMNKLSLVYNCRSNMETVYIYPRSSPCNTTSQGNDKTVEDD